MAQQLPESKLGHTKLRQQGFLWLGMHPKGNSQLATRSRMVIALCKRSGHECNGFRKKQKTVKSLDELETLKHPERGPSSPTRRPCSWRCARVPQVPQIQTVERTVEVPTIQTVRRRARGRGG